VRPGEPWQVLADCPHCRVEAAVVEWMDPTQPGCAEGVPAEAACRMCGWTAIAGEQTVAPSDLRDPERARAALARWAAEDGLDADAFARANMGLGAGEVVERLVRGEPVPTSFDVVAWLFPQSAGGTRAPGVADIRVTDGGPPPLPAPAHPPPRPPDRRAPGRFLASVMLADGDLQSDELAWVSAWLARHTLPALDPADLRVWRPHELGHVARELREPLIEAAAELAHLDRERDGSEWKVILAFARAWGVPDEKVRGWDRTYERRYGTSMSRLWRTLSTWVG
jgi:hypothetical protein